MEHVEKLALYLGIRYWKDKTFHKKAYAWYVLPDDFVNNGNYIALNSDEEMLFEHNPVKGAIAPGTIYVLSFTEDMKSILSGKATYKGTLGNKDQRLLLGARSSAAEAFYDEKKLEQTEQGLSAVKLYLKPMRETYRNLEHRQKIAFIAFIIREITL